MSPEGSAMSDRAVKSNALDVAFPAVAAALKAVVEAERPRLDRLSEAAASAKPGPTKWSAKQVLGHLIDSAANNHQRFVRMQTHRHLDLPGYEQDAWVSLAAYQQRAWGGLVELWAAYNLQLAHLLGHANPAAATHTWRNPDGEVVTLAWVAEDYVRHMRHHLAQIPGR
jgi:hypothetical protein